MPYYSVFAAAPRANGLNGEIIIAVFSGTLLHRFISGKKDETPPLETARHSDPSVESFWQLYIEIQCDDVQRYVYLKRKQSEAL